MSKVVRLRNWSRQCHGLFHSQFAANFSMIVVAFLVPLQDGLNQVGVTFPKFAVI